MNDEERLDKFAAVFGLFATRNQAGYELFAELLSDAVARQRPWQKTFIYNLLNRVEGFKVSDEMLTALERLERGEAGYKKQVIFSLYDVDNSIIRERCRGCQNPGCPETFVRTNPSGKYCSERCRMDAKNARRRARRKEKREARNSLI